MDMFDSSIYDKLFNSGKLGNQNIKSITDIKNNGTTSTNECTNGNCPINNGTSNAVTNGTTNGMMNGTTNNCPTGNCPISNGTMNGTMNGMMNGMMNNGMMNSGLSPFPAQTPIGMAYVPFQQWEKPYDDVVGFVRGTIFPSLDKPFIGEEAVRNG